MPANHWQQSIDPKLLRRLVRPLYAGLIAPNKTPNILTRIQRMLGHISLADEITAKWQSVEGGVQEGALPLAIGFWLRERTVDTTSQAGELPRPVVIVRRETLKPTTIPTPAVEKRVVTNSFHTRLIERENETHHYHERLIVRPQEEINTSSSAQSVQPVVRKPSRLPTFSPINPFNMSFIARELLPTQTAILLRQAAVPRKSDRFIYNVAKEVPRKFEQQRLIYQLEKDSPLETGIQSEAQERVASHIPQPSEAFQPSETVRLSEYQQRSWLERLTHPLRMTLTTQQLIAMPSNTVQSPVNSDAPALQPTVWLMRKLFPLNLNNTLSQQVIQQTMGSAEATPRGTVQQTSSVPVQQDTTYVTEMSPRPMGLVQRTNSGEPNDITTIDPVSSQQNTFIDVHFDSRPSADDAVMADDSFVYRQAETTSSNTVLSQPQRFTDRQPTDSDIDNTYPSTYFQTSDENTYITSSPEQHTPTSDFPIVKPSVYQNPAYDREQSQSESLHASESDEETKSFSQSIPQVRVSRQTPFDTDEGEMTDAQFPLATGTGRVRQSQDSIHDSETVRRNTGENYPNSEAGLPTQTPENQPLLRSTARQRPDLPHPFADLTPQPLASQSQPEMTEAQHPSLPKVSARREYIDVQPNLVDRPYTDAETNVRHAMSGTRLNPDSVLSQLDSEERRQPSRVTYENISDKQSLIDRKSFIPNTTDADANPEQPTSRRDVFPQTTAHRITSPKESPTVRRRFTPYPPQAPISESSPIVARAYRIPPEVGVTDLKVTRPQQSTSYQLHDIAFPVAMPSPTIPLASETAVLPFESEAANNLVHSQPLSRMAKRLQEQVEQTTRSIVQRHLESQPPPDVKGYQERKTETYTSSITDERYTHKKRIQETVELEVLVDKVMRRITQHMRTERERRGGGRWA
jgi:hypothetical protein